MENKENLVLIFDFDGVIADTAAHFKEIFDELVEHFKFREVSEEEWEDLRNGRVGDLFKKLKVPFYKIPLVVRQARTIFGRKLAEIKPIEGIGGVLKDFKKEGIKIGILTSNSKPNTKKFLENNNLDIFDFIYAEKNLFNKKRSLRKIIKKEKLAGKRIFYIGDEDRDIQAAKAAGIGSVAIAWGANNEEMLAKEDPDFLVRKPKDLMSFIGHFDKN